MKKNIIFITTEIKSSHNNNRILDFIKEGYNVTVYSFRRDNEEVIENQHYHINILGNILSSNYLKRLYVYICGINYILRNHNNNSNVIYFVFGLDLAIFLQLLGGRKVQYIYEEADLVQTYISNPFIQKILNFLDKRTILKSQLTVLTSKGFLDFHFPTGNIPKNITIVPNKLNSNISKFKHINTKANIQHLRVGFVGSARFDSIDFFVETFLANFPQHEFHFYGPVEDRMNRFGLKYNNVFYHGRFKNPNDLPKIYENIDILLCTYDYRIDNVRYAEPNKLYEAIYFRKPIIVSSNTFLSNKVSELNIGYHIDSLDKNSIVSFFNNLTSGSLRTKVNACSAIPREECIMNDTEFFEHIKMIALI